MCEFSSTKITKGALNNNSKDSYINIPVCLIIKIVYKLNKP